MKTFLGRPKEEHIVDGGPPGYDHGALDWYSPAVVAHRSVKTVLKRRMILTWPVPRASVLVMLNSILLVVPDPQDASLASCLMKLLDESEYYRNELSRTIISLSDSVLDSSSFCEI